MADQSSQVSRGETLGEPLGSGLVEPPDLNRAFPKLSEAHRARLRARGTLRSVARGEVLIQEGDREHDFFVIESGVITGVAAYGMEDRVLGVQGTGSFLGELNTLSGRRLMVTAVVRDPGVVIQVPRAIFEQLIASGDELAELIVRAYLARQAMMLASGVGCACWGGAHVRPRSGCASF